MTKLPPALLAELTLRYGEPARHYHTLAHVQALLNWLDAMRHLAVEPALIEAAIWFHDAVYDPRSATNEADSAALARVELQALGWPARDIGRVADLVTATARHQAAPGDADAQLFLDLDLSILGQPAEVYARYVAAVRAEYGWLDESRWREGRRRVLRSFLDRGAIYFTSGCRAMWEGAARANMQAELAVLEGH